MEEIGCILTITYLIFHTDNVLKISKESLELFILLYLCKSKVFSLYRSSEILTIKKHILTKEFITSFDISLQLGIFTHTDVETKTFFTLSKSQSIHIVQEILKLLLLRERVDSAATATDIQGIVLHAVSIDNVIFLREFLNVCDLTEDFLKRVISVTFQNGSAKIFSELYSNSITLCFIQKKHPQLLSLPEDYFETYKDSTGFLKAYLLSPFSVLNQNHSEFILRAALNESSYSIFIGLLDNENYPIHPDYLSKIFDNLNSLQTWFKYRTIAAFWNSSKIYNLFRESSIRERREIFDKIFQVPQGKLFYHMFALSECKFDYFGEFLDDQFDLKEYAVKLLLSDDENDDMIFIKTPFQIMNSSYRHLQL